MKQIKKSNYDNLKNLNSEQQACFNKLVDTIYNIEIFLFNGCGNYYQRKDAKKKLQQAKADMVFLLA